MAGLPLEIIRLTVSANADTLQSLSSTLDRKLLKFFYVFYMERFKVMSLRKSFSAVSYELNDLKTKWTFLQYSDSFLNPFLVVLSSLS